MKYLFFLIIIAFYSISVPGQNQKYIEVLFFDFSAYSPTLTGVGTGPILDEQEKDVVRQKDGNLQPSGVISLHFKNVSSVSNFVIKSKPVEEVTVKKIIFEDGTKLSF